MVKKVRRHVSKPSPAAALAFVALLLALGGGAAYALESNTIYSHHIVDRQVRAQDVAVRLAYGPYTTMGARGSGASQVKLSIAACPAGSKVMGGGWQGHPDRSSVNSVVPENRPGGPNTWAVIMINFDTRSARFRAVAKCVASTGVTASSSRSSLVSPELSRELRRLRARLSK